MSLPFVWANACCAVLGILGVLAQRSESHRESSTAEEKSV
jgi:hypothetical protein